MSADNRLKSSPGRTRPAQLERYARRVGRERAVRALGVAAKHHGHDGAFEFLDLEEPPDFLEGAFEGDET